ncbi:MAG: hypothetical protein JSU01_12350 [Bacteroidetes bacterium]|nr:hypothetical protein [Bacteroidota bacterium]
MKLSKRLLTVLNILLLALCIIFAYAYMNSLVSYKYEVQADEFAGNILNGHQREIISYITSSETWAFVCLGCFLVTFIIKVSQPSFHGRITYTD